MKRLACVLLLVGCGSGSHETTGPVPVQLAGAVQKGPFVLGSTIQLSTVDAAGNPTGQVFPTQTADDLGDFTLNFTYQGNASIEGDGFYWNEATGQLSNASLTLRAFYDVTTSGSQSAYVNIVTHLTHERIKTLLAASPPPALSDAVTQAETELRAALGIGGPNFNPMASGIEMNVAGGDNDANAYLFAVSAILAEIAKEQAGTGSVDAQLQQLINTISSSFAGTGQVSTSLQQQIASLQEAANPLNAAPPTIDPQALMDQLGMRLSQIGSTATVPDLNRVWDTDGDGVPNATDNCPFIYNPDQSPVNGICRFTIASYPNNGAAALADFNGDGSLDILGWTVAGNNNAPDDVYVLLGDGDGNFPTTVSTPGTTTNTVLTDPNDTQTGSGEMTGFFPLIGDFDKDGKLDLVAESMTVLAGDNYEGYTAFLPGDGMGHVGAGVQMTSTNLQPTSSSWPYVLHQVVMADFDKDGFDDWVAASYEDTRLWIGRGLTSRSWGTPTQISIADKVLVRGLVTADFNKDGNPDIAFASHGGTFGANTFVSGIYVFLGTGSSTAPFFTSATSSPITSITGLTGLYTADLNADGKADLIAASADVTILFGDGTGQFANPIVATGAGTTQDSTVWVYPGDFTGDGKLDLLTWSPNLPIRLFVGDGSAFPTSTSIWVPGFAATTLMYDQGGVIAGDLNGDGIADLVASGYGRGGGQSFVKTVLINATP